MGEFALRVVGLGKQYRLGDEQDKGGYPRITDAIANRLVTWARQFRHPNQRAASEQWFWALRDVTFEVREGEAVGIIGHNGAGKSTLLKILSRITRPTTGRLQTRGRLGSLLEVGTGFHPELTGRENIFLNGAIMGMTQDEVKRRFDEIVAFSELDRFLDTPVKRYSSGMYMRLAFSVAVHLEPEIVILDEVLAVGDAAFQKKCLAKMNNIVRQGKTMLFVSHNMQAMASLCPRVILLDHGRIACDGPSEHVIKTYLPKAIDGSVLTRTAAREWDDEHGAPGNMIARLRAVRVRDEDNQTAEMLDVQQPVGIEMEYEILEPCIVVPNFDFYTDDGICAFVIHDWDPVWSKTARPKGRYVSTVWIPSNFLNEGTLLVGAALSTYNPLMTHFYEREAVAFTVVDGRNDGKSTRGDFNGTIPGVVRPCFTWTTHVKTHHSV